MTTATAATSEAMSDALVLFGVSGDLAEKKIFPALQSMVRRGRLRCPVYGIARRKWTLDQFKDRVRESIERHSRLDADAFERLASLLHYVEGDYGDQATFVKLRKALGTAQRPLFYLAIPPSMFATVTEGLAKAGCTKDARVVLEKPFGRSLASARALNTTLHRSFPERAIFRIDHYLGKEAVQNLLYFRFANPHVEAIWNNRYIDYVQVTMAESFGIEGRGKFYEETGAVRDVVQNHMLQIVACLAMECPVDGDAKALRDERSRILSRIPSLDGDHVVLGQYDGYRQEPDVAPDSRVETFAAARFGVANERWAGVPFLVRAGKRLPVTITEVMVNLKLLPRAILDEAKPPPADHYRFRLSPSVVLALGADVKTPGERMVGKQIEMIACQQASDVMDPYDRLLGDALRGDGALFAREDAVEAAWRIVDPILDAEQPFGYAPGTWGPPEAARLLPAGARWSDPTEDDICR